MHQHASPDQPDAVLKSGHYFTLLANAITDYAVCTLDGQGRIRSLNPGGEHMLGYSTAEVLDQHFTYFYASNQDLTADVSSPEPQTDYGWCTRKDQSRFQARAVLSAVDAALAGGSGFVLVIQNLSQSVTARQALIERERRFQTLVQGVRDYAIYMLDPDGYITNWNAGATLIKGYDEDEIVGQHFSCFYTPEDKARNEPQRSLDMALKHNAFQNEALRIRKDGSEFWASIVIDPIFDENGTLLGYAKVTRDITEQKQTRDKAVQQREAQHQSQKLEAIGRLTGSVAHDFNNLLAIIRTAAEMLAASPSLTPHKRSRYTRMILDTTNRAVRLIDQLLSFARRQPLQRQVFCIADRIRKFRPIIQTTVGSRLTLHISFSDDIEPVDTDPSQFETAVLNMVINARDATPEGGEITIRGRTEMLDWLGPDGNIEKRAFTVLSISDTGAGIAAAVLPNIFEPFFTTKDVDKGTGLGLSQVYGFAKQSGGDVVVESEPGKGTCFTLYLPCATHETQGWDGVLSPLAQRMFEQD